MDLGVWGGMRAGRRDLMVFGPGRLEEVLWWYGVGGRRVQRMLQSGRENSTQGRMDRMGLVKV